MSSLICEKGLRYDLTVPFARYVVQHREEIVFPFRRYQIQPVWRADRPQKGRYREFFQCDADVIGSDSLLNEYELIRIIDDVFTRLDINVIIKINHRKVLSGIAEYIGEAAKITDITVAIDKLDKIGIDEVNRELAGKGIPDEAIERLRPVLDLSGDTQAKLARLQDILSESETGLRGIGELKTLFSYISGSPLKNDTELDLTQTNYLRELVVRKGKPEAYLSHLSMIIGLHDFREIDDGPPLGFEDTKVKGQFKSADAAQAVSGATTQFPSVTG